MPLAESKEGWVGKRHQISRPALPLLLSHKDALLSSDLSMAEGTSTYIYMSKIDVDGGPRSKKSRKYQINKPLPRPSTYIDSSELP